MLAYFKKWAEMTEIYTLTVFFNYILLFCKRNYKIFTVGLGEDGMCISLIYQDGEHLSLNYTEKIYYTLMQDFMKKLIKTMKITKEQLPANLAIAYDKWRTITDIDNLNSFFEDFYIFCKEKTPKDNINVFDCLTFNEIKKGEYYDGNIVMAHGKDLELSLWRIKDEHLYVYLTKYIEEINEQYEYFRRTNT